MFCYSLTESDSQLKKKLLQNATKLKFPVDIRNRSTDLNTVINYLTRTWRCAISNPKHGKKQNHPFNGEQLVMSLHLLPIQYITAPCCSCWGKKRGISALAVLSASLDCALVVWLCASEDFDGLARRSLEDAIISTGNCRRWE